jgi:hypothetical protein
MDNVKTAAKKLNAATEADAKSIDGRSGRSAKSSKNAKSHTKANTGQGVGGGKKQQRQH